MSGEVEQEFGETCSCLEVTEVTAQAEVSFSQFPSFVSFFFPSCSSSVDDVVVAPEGSRQDDKEYC
jgi:hypothetical protein